MEYRYTKIKALAFVGILSSISLVLVLITYFFSGLGIVLLLVLPLLSALVSVSVNYKFSLIYILSTFLICLIDFQLALFIILPSLLIGLIFGKMICYKGNNYFAILLTSILLTFIQMGSTNLINIIYNVDLINVYSQMFKIDYLLFNDLYYLFLFTISLIQSSLTCLIITNELKKIKIVNQDKLDSFTYVTFMNIVTTSMSALLLFGIPQLGYLLLGISLFLTVLEGYYHFSYKRIKLSLVIQIPLYAVSIILIFSLLGVVEKVYYPLLLLLIPTSSLIYSLIIYIISLVKKERLDASIFESRNILD